VRSRFRSGRELLVVAQLDDLGAAHAGGLGREASHQHRPDRKVGRDQYVRRAVGGRALRSGATWKPVVPITTCTPASQASASPSDVGGEVDDDARLGSTSASSTPSCGSARPPGAASRALHRAHTTPHVPGGRAATAITGRAAPPPAATLAAVRAGRRRGGGAEAPLVRPPLRPPGAPANASSAASARRSWILTASIRSSPLIDRISRSEQAAR
jgi:hypothetical protein